MSMKAAASLTPFEINHLRAENKRLRQHGEALEQAVRFFLKQMDVVMQQPSTPDRGAQVARLMNTQHHEVWQRNIHLWYYRFTQSKPGGA